MVWPKNLKASVPLVCSFTLIVLFRLTTLSSNPPLFLSLVPAADFSPSSVSWASKVEAFGGALSGDPVRSVTPLLPSLKAALEFNETAPFFAAAPRASKCLSQRWAVVVATGAVDPGGWDDVHNGWCLVIVALTEPGAAVHKSRTHFPGLAHITFLSVFEQERWAKVSPLVAAMPWNYSGRKNVGYLFAVLQGAHVVLDVGPNINIGSLTVSNNIQGSDRDDGVRSEKRSHLLPPSLLSLLGDLSSPSPSRPVLLDMWNVTASEGVVSNSYSWLLADDPRDRNSKGDRPRTILTPIVHAAVKSDDVGIFQCVVSGEPNSDQIFETRQPAWPPSSSVPEPPDVGERVVVIPPGVLARINGQTAVYHRSSLWALLLPVGVPQRVSNVWRSYFAQSMGRHFRDAPRTAFMDPCLLGPTMRPVAHDDDEGWKSSNLMGDERAVEMKLKTFLAKEFQCGAGPHEQGLVTELEPILSSLPPFAHCLIELYLELYKRNYIGAVDVSAIATWLAIISKLNMPLPITPVSQAVEKVSTLKLNGSVNSRKKGRKRFPTESRVSEEDKVAFRRLFSNILVLVKFNYDTSFDLIEAWTTSMGQVFENILVVGPFTNETVTAVEEMGVGVLLCDPDKGFFSPYSVPAAVMLESIRAQNARFAGAANNTDDTFQGGVSFPDVVYKKDYDGLFVMHDDVIIDIANFILKFDPDVPWQTQRGGVERLLNFTETKAKDLRWFNSKYGTVRMVQLMDMLKGTESEVTRESRVWCKSQSDVFYVPKNDFEAWATLAEKAAKVKLFLEIAVPFVFGAVDRGRAGDQVAMSTRQLNLCTSFFKRRLYPFELVAKCNGAWDILHPVKMRKSPSEFRLFLSHYEGIQS